MADAFPNFDLTGQVVLVTAAARGLGRACALACGSATLRAPEAKRDVGAGMGGFVPIDRIEQTRKRPIGCSQYLLTAFGMETHDTLASPSWKSPILVSLTWQSAPSGLREPLRSTGGPWRARCRRDKLDTPPTRRTDQRAATHPT